MKRVLLGLLLVMFAVSAQAREIEPGTVKLSGATNASIFNTTFEVDGEEVSDTSNFSVEADAVYFLTKNIGVGGTVAYDRSKTDYPAGLGGGWDKDTTIIIGPMLAVDVPLSETLNFIADAKVGYFQMTFEDDTSGKYFDADGLAWGVAAGFAMFPAKHVSLDLTAAYQSLDGDDSVSDLSGEASTIGLNLGVSVYFD